MNLYQKINEVRKLIKYVQKDKSVSTGAGGGSYKAVTHDQVTAMVRPHMIAQGIISYPILVESVSNPKEVNANMETAKQFRYEATYDIVFINADEPSEAITIRIQAHAMDNGDKACGKALSYAKKYALLKLFEIESGDDEESRYAEKEEFSLEFYSDLIKSSATIDELKENYQKGADASKKAKDASAFKALGALTNQIKAKLGEQNAN
jgi:hypothetical protein